MFQYSLKSLNARKVISILFTLSIVVLLVVSMMSVNIYNRVQEGFFASDGKYDVVVGPDGSANSLVLSSMYFSADATDTIPYDYVNQLRSRGDLDLVVPVAMGDSYKGSAMVGTSEDLLRGYEYSAGKVFKKANEVVLGANVALENKLGLGDSLISTHGTGEELSNSDHKSHPYIVVGILDSTATAYDNTVFTAVESIWNAHGVGDEEVDVTEHIDQVLSEADKVLQETEKNTAAEIKSLQTETDALLKEVNEATKEAQTTMDNVAEPASVDVKALEQEAEKAAKEATPATETKPATAAPATAPAATEAKPATTTPAPAATEVKPATAAPATAPKPAETKPATAATATAPKAAEASIPASAVESDTSTPAVTKEAPTAAKTAPVVAAPASTETAGVHDEDHAEENGEMHGEEHEKAVTAILIRSGNMNTANTVIQEFKEDEKAQAINPTSTLRGLMENLDLSKQVAQLLCGIIIILSFVVISIMSVLMYDSNKQDVQTLRFIGLPRGKIAQFILYQNLFLLSLGSLLAIGLSRVGLYFANRISSELGIVLEVGKFYPTEWYMVAGVVVICFIPAIVQASKFSKELN